MKSFIADVISEEPLLTEASCRRRGSACLYALGGTLSNSGAWTGAMERYDPLGDAWVAVEPTLGTARLYGVAALLDGRIYVAGGFSQATMASVMSEVNIELNFPPKFRGARSRLYRRRFLHVNTRWKALAEIYTMHSFAPLPFSNLNF